MKKLHILLLILWIWTTFLFRTAIPAPVLMALPIGLMFLMALRWQHLLPTLEWTQRLIIIPAFMLMCCAAVLLFVKSQQLKPAIQVIGVVIILLVLLVLFLSFRKQEEARAKYRKLLPTTYFIFCIVAGCNLQLLWMKA